MRKQSEKKENKSQKMAKSMSRFAIVMCIVVIGVILVFAQQKKDAAEKKGQTGKASEFQILAEKDLELAYPGTPVEVVKLFGRYNKCIYNAPIMDDDRLKTLLNQMRTMYSNQLLQQNALEAHAVGMKKEVNSFAKAKKKIISYTVDKSSSVQYQTINGQECAYLQMAFFTLEDSTYTKVFQDYILVKENNRWKILAFRKKEQE